jgi:hypothetical protein
MDSKWSVRVDEKARTAHTVTEWEYGTPSSGPVAEPERDRSRLQFFHAPAVEENTRPRCELSHDCLNRFSAGSELRLFPIVEIQIKPIVQAIGTDRPSRYIERS